MGSMSATFPSMRALTSSSSHHVVRGGFDFMIPASSSSDAAVGMAQRFVGVPGIQVQVRPQTGLAFALNSWNLDTWTHLDFLFTPRRFDVWINSNLVASIAVSGVKATYGGVPFVSPSCEMENYWVMGGDLHETAA